MASFGAETYLFHCFHPMNCYEKKEGSHEEKDFKDLSHLNIQVSENFSIADVIAWSVSPTNGGETYDIGTNFDGNTWNAFKFDDLGDALSYTLTLETNRIAYGRQFLRKGWSWRSYLRIQH